MSVRVKKSCFKVLIYLEKSNLKGVGVEALYLADIDVSTLSNSMSGNKEKQEKWGSLIEPQYLKISLKMSHSKVSLQKFLIQNVWLKYIFQNVSLKYIFQMSHSRCLIQNVSLKKSHLKNVSFKISH